MAFTYVRCNFPLIFFPRSVCGDGCEDQGVSPGGVEEACRGWGKEEERLVRIDEAGIGGWGLEGDGEGLCISA